MVKSLLPVSLTDEGMVKRVRGVAYSCRMPPQTSNRLVDGVRGMLNDLLADVYVFTDHMSGAAAGASPGYGVTLVAESTSGRLVAAQASSEGQVTCCPCMESHSHIGEMISLTIALGPTICGRCCVARS